MAAGTEPSTSRTATEIATQPRCWQQAAEEAIGFGAALPQHGERVAVSGCGTSWFMAQAYAALREAAGQGETDAFASSEFPTARAGSYDRVVAITRSGTTTEVLELLGALRDRTRTIALTADPGTPVMEAADHVAVLDYADERSVVQTRFATSALAFLRGGLEQHGELPVKTVAEAAVDAEQAVTGRLPRTALEAEQWTFLGHGWAYGLALEAALKMREAAGAWTEAYPAMEYRHGPIAVTGPGRVVWLFGSLPAGQPATGQSATRQLATEVGATGGTLIADSGGGSAAPGAAGGSGGGAAGGSAGGSGTGAGTGAAGNDEPSRVLDPMADLVRAQRLAVAVAETRGLDPDQPRNLTRSVILS